MLFPFKVIVFGCGIEASATEAKGTVLLKGENRRVIKSNQTNLNQIKSNQIDIN